VIQILFFILAFAAQSCDPLWTEYKGHCYYFYNATQTLAPQTFNDSRFICQRLGGDLLTIRDADEQNYISNFFNDPSISRNNYWIGIYTVNIINSIVPS